MQNETKNESNYKSRLLHTHYRLICDCQKMSQDLFDLMSSPATTPQHQPSFQSGQFNNMSVSMHPNPLAGPNPSTVGFLSAPNAPMPQSLFSQPSPSGQMMGAFPVASNMPPTSTDQFAGLFSMQSTTPNQTTMPGALGQPTLPLGHTAQQQGSLFGQNNQQNTSVFGQTGQQSNQFFGQDVQQGFSVFGQDDQQGNSIFGQASQQNPSIFGQSGQQNPTPLGLSSQQNTSPFGQSGQQNTSVFGQSTQQNTSPFGQSVQQNSFPFGQTSQQPASLLAQQPTGQTAQQPQGLFGQSSQQSAFGALSLPSQSNSFQLDGFPSMPKTPTNTPTTGGMMQSAAPDNLFGRLTATSLGSNANSTGVAFQNPFVATVMANQNNNAASDDFFAAFSSPSSNTKPDSSPISLPPSARNEDFLDAFASATTISNKPAPSSATSSNTNFDIFYSPAESASGTRVAPNNATASDSTFNPFGNFATQAEPSSTPQQQAAVESLFDDTFSTAPAAAAPTVTTSTTSDSEKQRSPIISEPVTQPKEAPTSFVSEVKVQESKETMASEEISDPVLREINEKFGGRWKMLRSDPYDEYLKSVGVGLVHRKRAGTGSPEQLFEVKDGLIHITIKSSIHSQYYVVKLNEEMENLVEKIPQSVFCSYSNGKLYLQMTPVGDAFGKTQEVERFINDNNEHVVIHSAGIASCRRYFGKMEPTPTKGVVIASSKPADSTPAQENAKTTPVTSTETANKPTQVVVTPNQDVQKSSVPDNTCDVAPPRAATPEMVLELRSPPPPAEKPATPMTPGQMLLQNLQELGDNQADGSGDIIDNGNVLIFSKNGTDESDA